jgi:ABC-type dipeptide/oligopeptide/nickel transport system permease subunit
LLDYATQGAQVVALPALSAGILVALFGILGGLLRCTGSVSINAWIQWFSEIVGALPRMVVILVVALLLPWEYRSLFPLAWAWALLSAPGAMDEAASVAERLGGSRFVEALRAHGYSASRIFLVHVVGYNLRPVVVRQGAETMMNVVFLEIALSYLALAENQPSFTHADSLKSWADLLKIGYPSLIPSLGYDSGHALALGLVLLGLVAVCSIAVGRAARAR